MPILMDFALGRAEDGILTVVMTPSVNISGWTIQSQVTNRAGGISGLIVKSCASGFNNVSGINVTDGTKGVFNVTLASNDSSGLNYGNYFVQTNRLDSGSMTHLVQGFWLLTP
ncbi:MAG: hypothetical protein KGL39_12665 [Patescibacteria group bacterium]|nr:hypothetical protein [Patescibacteria group bacterium]